MQLLDSTFMERATPEDIKKQLAAGADVNARDKEGFTPLSYAIRWSQDPKVVRALIQAGADIHAKTACPAEITNMWKEMRETQKRLP